MCFSCSFNPSRRQFIGGAAIAAMAMSFRAIPASAQMPVNFGPAPDGGPPVPEFVTHGLGGRAAQTTMIGAGMGIIYDSGWLQQGGGPGAPLHRFTRAHEYGHIRHNHIPNNPMQYAQFELEADCYAKRILAGQNDVQAIQAGIMVYQQVLPPMDTLGMPGSQRRIMTINQC